MKNKSGETQPMPPDLKLLTPKEAARFINLSESFLAKARMRGDGPRYLKLSRSVRYSNADLLLWLKACAKTSTAEGQQDDRRHQGARKNRTQAPTGMQMNGDPVKYTSTRRD